VTSFENNLLAGAMILAVDLLVTYAIIAKLLQRQDDLRWKAAREWLIPTIKGRSRTTLLVWAFEANSPLVGMPPDLSDENHQKIVQALRDEIAHLDSHPLEKLQQARTSNYWINVATGLGSSDDFVGRSMRQAEIALRDRPDLLKPLLELEEAHHGIAAFRADKDNFGNRQVAAPLPGLILKALRLHLQFCEEVP
jgi:hypothetical protein